MLWHKAAVNQTGAKPILQCDNFQIIGHVHAAVKILAGFGGVGGFALRQMLVLGVVHNQIFGLQGSGALGCVFYGAVLNGVRMVLLLLAGQAHGFVHQIIDTGSIGSAVFTVRFVAQIGKRFPVQ